MPSKEERKMKREQRIQEIKMAERNDTEKLEDGEKKVDVKGTFELLVEEEKPEISQEEEIKQYREGDAIKKPKKKKNSSDEDDEAEDDEHLKRVKQELLESLERVNKLAKILFSEKEKVGAEKAKAKEKEKTRENTREKVIDDREKGGIERTRED